MKTAFETGGFGMSTGNSTHSGDGMQQQYFRMRVEAGAMTRSDLMAALAMGDDRLKAWERYGLPCDESLGIGKRYRWTDVVKFIGDHPAMEFPKIQPKKGKPK